MVRKTVLLAFCLFLSIGLAVAACGGGGSDKGKDGEECKDDGTCNTGLHCTQSNVCMANIDLATFTSETAAIACQWLLSCCNQAELDEFEAVGLVDAGTFDSQAACETEYGANIQENYSDHVETAISNGRGEYFADNAAACLALGAALTCSGNGVTVLQDMLVLCADSYDGLQGANDPCNHQVVCSAGLQFFDNTCLEPLAQDAACVVPTLGNPVHLCAAGLFCETNLFTCQPVATAGAPCDSGFDFSCEAGYECDNPDGDYVCIALQEYCAGE